MRTFKVASLMDAGVLFGARLWRARHVLPRRALRSALLAALSAGLAWAGMSVSASAQTFMSVHPVPPLPIGGVPPEDTGKSDDTSKSTDMQAAAVLADNGTRAATDSAPLAFKDIAATLGSEAAAAGQDTHTPAVTAAATAADAALAMATMLDGAGGGVSGDELLLALQGAADAGQPMAMWRLGVMYENGEGVKKDQAQAFRYFSRIANEHANTPPRSLEADIVAQSFLKIGQYYRDGLPGAGIKADSNRSVALILHAASYFGDADAQYQVGEMYLSKDGTEHNALQAARWLSLAARKGHVPAQATLGDLLFNGEGIEAQPVEGLMWLTIAHNHAAGTPEQDWVDELLSKAMSVATPEQQAEAIKAADAVSGHLHG